MIAPELVGTALFGNAPRKRTGPPPKGGFPAWPNSASATGNSSPPPGVDPPDKARGPEPGAIPCSGPRGLGSHLASPTLGDQFRWEPTFSWLWCAARD